MYIHAHSIRVKERIDDRNLVRLKLNASMEQIAKFRRIHAAPLCPKY